MKAGKIILGLVGVGGLAFIGYKAYKIFTEPKPLTPALPGQPGGAVNTIADAIKNITSTVSSAVQNLTPQTNYEGKLVRINRGSVYLVKDNMLRYVSKLSTAGWAQVVEVGSLALPQGPALSDAEMNEYGIAGLGSLGRDAQTIQLFI